MSFAGKCHSAFIYCSFMSHNPDGIIKSSSNITPPCPWVATFFSIFSQNPIFASRFETGHPLTLDPQTYKLAKLNI